MQTKGTKQHTKSIASSRISEEGDAPCRGVEEELLQDGTGAEEPLTPWKLVQVPHHRDLQGQPEAE